MKIVLIDIDSTLNNFQEHFLKVFRERHPSVATAAEKYETHYDVMKLDKPKAMAILTEPGFTEALRPLDGAVEAVHELDRRGYHVIFCTSLVADDSDTLRERVQWIGKWFGQRWMERVVFTGDKSLVRGDVLIDDSPFRTKGVMTPEWKLIIFDVPYNHGDAAFGRIYNWTDLDVLFGLLERL